MDRSDHVFHRHCFTGEAQELRQWQKELPPAKFGVKMESIQDPRTVALIPPERLLLETDAPYLPPAPGCRLNHPWNVLSLAKQVAFIRNTPPSLLLKVANANAMDIYGCP
nr:3'-5' ssDNA/RNA exonuclease TatD-like [Crassostrea gigas]